MLSFTGCEFLSTFGKDDFFGTWVTLDFPEDAKSTDEAIHYYNVGESYYKVTWNFDGKSENLFGGNSAVFKQHLEKYKDAALTDLANETYWTGIYKTKGNSDYSRGKLLLYYEFGVDIDSVAGGTGADKADDRAEWLMKVAGATFAKQNPTEEEKTNYPGWKNADFLNYCFYGTTEPSEEAIASREDKLSGKDLLDAEELTSLSPWEFNNTDTGYHSTKMNADTKNGKYIYDTVSGGYVKNGVTIQVRNSKNTVCSDIEYFRYNLKDSSGIGYTRMMVSTLNPKGTNFGGIYNKWLEKSDANTEAYGSYNSSLGYKLSNTCSWAGVTERYAGRSSTEDKEKNGLWDDWQYSSYSKNTSYLPVTDDADTTDYDNFDADVCEQ